MYTPSEHLRGDDDDRINGVAVGLNLGRIIFGGDPEEDERRRLVWYLTRLSSRLYRLPLRGLDEQLEQGKGIGLPQVYVMLVSSISISRDSYRLEEVLRYYNPDERTLKKEYDPDWALPSDTISIIDLYDNETRRPMSSYIEIAEFHDFLKRSKVDAQQKFLVFKPNCLQRL